MEIIPTFGYVHLQGMGSCRIFTMDRSSCERSPGIVSVRPCEEQSKGRGEAPTCAEHRSLGASLGLLVCPERSKYQSKEDSGLLYRKLLST